jgi:hypothetical protein
MIGLVISRAEDLLRLGRKRRRSLAAARRGADQYQMANQLRLGERQFLGHKREAQYVDLREAQCVDKGGGVGSHLLDRGRHLAGAAGDAGIVEQDDLAVLGETICHSRVPIVHRAGEVHVEDERHATRFAEASVSEPNTNRVYDWVGAVS